MGYRRHPIQTQVPLANYRCVVSPAFQHGRHCGAIGFDQGTAIPA